jgi:hypothetical protein
MDTTHAIVQACTYQSSSGRILFTKFVSFESQCECCTPEYGQQLCSSEEKKKKKKKKRSAK